MDGRNRQTEGCNIWKCIDYEISHDSRHVSRVKKILYGTRVYRAKRVMVITASSTSSKLSELEAGYWV